MNLIVSWGQLPTRNKIMELGFPNNKGVTNELMIECFPVSYQKYFTEIIQYQKDQTLPEYVDPRVPNEKKKKIKLKKRDKEDL